MTEKVFGDVFNSENPNVTQIWQLLIDYVYSMTVLGDSTQIRPNKSHFDFKLYISKA